MEATDDFTIVLDEPGNLESCSVEVFKGLGQLWNLVQRYGMKTPLTISVLDGQSNSIRTLKAARDKTGSWKLTDETPSRAPFEDKPITFPLIINSKDPSGNILKMRVTLDESAHSSERSIVSNRTVSPD